jgi:hypothetical protein
MPSIEEVVQKMVCKRLGHWPKGEAENWLVESLVVNVITISLSISDIRKAEERMAQEFESAMAYHNAGIKPPVLDGPVSV